jgi:hypothetical protein
MSKRKNGKIAALFNFAIGTLVEGDGAVALADDSWYMTAAKASTGSQLPGEVGQIFKTPTAAINAITPVSGDNAYPLTLSQVCKGDTSISASNGTVEVTDDCDGGFTAMILDGFTDFSGSFSGFMKFKDADGDLASADQEDFLNRFFDVVTDDGAGTYTVTAKDDSKIIIGILDDKELTAVGAVQIWQLVPALLTELTLDKPLKGAQNIDFSWAKAEGPASIYKRTTVADEVVF